ncbi:hypothetical protein C8F04DRAFT_1178884 [Mycena alexandri]|uniref:Uncharacterized protein n=1 Tax=Mycena alexandri TaxID=1745969 RepID=A0AAD6T3X0_9AGAR|nr:hypothetical protein C8F04DRAFT_1178884 [Mycena alexandri]
MVLGSPHAGRMFLANVLGVPKVGSGKAGRCHHELQAVEYSTVLGKCARCGHDSNSMTQNLKETLSAWRRNGAESGRSREHGRENTERESGTWVATWWREERGGGIHQMSTKIHQSRDLTVDFIMAFSYLLNFDCWNSLDAFQAFYVNNIKKNHKRDKWHIICGVPIASPAKSCVTSIMHINQSLEQNGCTDPMMVLSNIDFFKDIIYPCSTIPLVAKFVLEFYLSGFGCFTLSRCDRKLGCWGVEGSWKAGVAIYIGVPERDRAV